MICAAVICAHRSPVTFFQQVIYAHRSPVTFFPTGDLCAQITRDIFPTGDLCAQITRDIFPTGDLCAQITRVIFPTGDLCAQITRDIFPTGDLCAQITRDIFPTGDLSDLDHDLSYVWSIRLLAAIACEFGWDICHLDANQAFVQSKLDELVFIRLPPGCGELRQGCQARTEPLWFAPDVTNMA